MHIVPHQPGGQLGLHSASRDLTSRWLAIDIDLHDPDDNLSVSREGNLAAARGWFQVLVQKGLDPLLLDSNGIGGLHLFVDCGCCLGRGHMHPFGLENSGGVGVRHQKTSAVECRRRSQLGYSPLSGMRPPSTIVTTV